MTLKKIIINKKYLFLDRDGVINKRKVDDYITKWEDFEFLSGVLEAMNVFSKYFDRIIIITNQQGIGKKIMTDHELDDIHTKLKETILKHNGKIDAIYYCAMLRDKINNCRKPNITMAEQAQKQFPEIIFNQSIMIGDTSPDMEFGKNAGMARILLQNEHTTEKDKQWAEISINSLTELANQLK